MSKDKNKKTINIKCRVCGNRKNNESLTAKELALGIRSKFDYILCSACKSLSIVTIPSDIQSYYKNYPNLINNVKKIGFFRKRLFNYLLSNNRNSWISKILNNMEKSYEGLKIKALHSCNISKTAKILDIGCGNGEFVLHLQSLGFNNVLGIDPFLDKKSCVLSNKLIKKNILDMQGVFDVIIFNHTFEHLDNLPMICKKVDSLLSKKGLCIIRMPNIESLSFKIFKEHWEGIHAPFHIALPSQRGMDYLFKNTRLYLKEKRWEQPFQLIFYNINRLLDIADFDSLGARNFFSSKHFFKGPPPLFNKKEFSYLKNKSKIISKTSLCDYINYYFIKH